MYRITLLLLAHFHFTEFEGGELTGIVHQEIPIYQLRQTTLLSTYLHLSAIRPAPAKPHHVLSTKVREATNSNKQQSR
jgi:hypothetical protein